MQRLRIDQDIRSMSEFRTGMAFFMKQVHDTNPVQPETVQFTG
ncbi:MAG: hypothetical protein U9R57_14835 [Thermodesulfobacteriota bacterium]|nr:hypothetical protein [Thermodesulfobacteriota bacterium]